MIAEKPNPNHDQDDLVPARDACPMCGERNPDRLVWIDHERVRCLNCNAVYASGGAP